MAVKEFDQQGKAAAGRHLVAEEFAGVARAQVGQQSAAQRALGDSADVVRMDADLPGFAESSFRGEGFAQVRTEAAVAPDHGAEIGLKDQRVHARSRSVEDELRWLRASDSSVLYRCAVGG